MKRNPCLLAGALAALTISAPISARSAAIQQPAAPLPLPAYGALVSQIERSPTLVDAVIKSATPIRGAEAVGLESGHARFYVTADVLALIRGPAAPAQLGYVVDVPLDARGRAPKLRRLRVLLFARPVDGRPAQLQLTGAHGQRDWSPELDARVRQIAQQLAAADALPRITGIGNVFHVPGTLPGEGETQIFLMTSTGAPISLIVLRRPGQDPRWAVSLGEIVDDTAGPPAPGTLLHYRLACGLPASLPAASLAAETPENAAVAQEDYRLIVDRLGGCTAE